MIVKEKEKIKGRGHYGNYTEAKGLTRIDKELSISNSINIGEVSGGNATGGAVGGLYNAVNSAGIKLYSHNTSFNVVGCSNRGNIWGGGNSGGIVGQAHNMMSYAGINSQATANVVTNKLIIKYCFNTGDIDGTGGGKAGIGGRFDTYTGSNGTTRGGKCYTEISNNYNTGSVPTVGGSVSGILSIIANYIYGSNSYFDVAFLNNLNTGMVKTNSSSVIGGLITYFNTIGDGLSLSSINVFVSSCYNYSTNMLDGDANNRGGVIGYFGSNSSCVTLSNNYSAYKRNNGGVGIDNNTHGTTTNGANVGEKSQIT